MRPRDDLLTLLDDSDQTVRLAAIFALGRIGGQDAVDALEALTLESNTVESEAADLALEDDGLLRGSRCGAPLG